MTDGWTEERRSALLAILVGEEHLGLFHTSAAFHNGVMYLAGKVAGGVEALADAALEREGQAMIEMWVRENEARPSWWVPPRDEERP